MSELRIGTRGSALAIWQANWVRDALNRAHPDLRVTVQVIRTRGDRDQNAPLSGMPATGIFTREIENALLAGEVDLAVHSLKDLPTEMAPGLNVRTRVHEYGGGAYTVTDGVIAFSEFDDNRLLLKGTPDEEPIELREGGV